MSGTYVFCWPLDIFPGSGESSIVAIIVLLPSILGQFTLNYMHDRSQPGIASNPGFPFRILSRRKLRDKIWNGKPGFEAKPGTHCREECFGSPSSIPGCEARQEQKMEK